MQSLSRTAAVAEYRFGKLRGLVPGLLENRDKGLQPIQRGGQSFSSRFYALRGMPTHVPLPSPSTQS